MAKVSVNKNLCIGCGACVSLCPACFKMGVDNKSEPVGPECNCQECSCNEVAENCPVKAIKIE